MTKWINAEELEEYLENIVWFQHSTAREALQESKEFSEWVKSKATELKAIDPETRTVAISACKGTQGSLPIEMLNHAITVLEGANNPKPDCEYHYFKQSGKWYSSERGLLPRGDITRATIIEANGGMPGLSSDGSTFIIVVIPDDSYPRMLTVKDELPALEAVKEALEKNPKDHYFSSLDIQPLVAEFENLRAENERLKNERSS